MNNYRMDDIALLYRFSDFTLENYVRLLTIAKKNYTFISFHQLNKCTNKCIALRHDVEFSIPIAMLMAETEHALGIKSTWFFQVHGDFYNLLEKNTFKALKKIQSMGHEIGLHFDIHFWNIQNDAELEKYMKFDKKIFEDYFSVKPRIFSFHNTNAFIQSCENETYAGMMNVYSKQIKSTCKYCSDSTGYWRFEILENTLRKATDNKLHILIHDGMWQNEILPPRRRAYKVIDDHAEFMKLSYDETLKKFGAKNIDWEGEI